MYVEALKKISVLNTFRVRNDGIFYFFVKIRVSKLSLKIRQSHLCMKGHVKLHLQSKFLRYFPIEYTFLSKNLVFWFATICIEFLRGFKLSFVSFVPIFLRVNVIPFLKNWFTMNKFLDYQFNKNGCIIQSQDFIK